MSHYEAKAEWTGCFCSAHQDCQEGVRQRCVLCLESEVRRLSAILKNLMSDMGIESIQTTAESEEKSK